MYNNDNKIFEFVNPIEKLGQKERNNRQTARLTYFAYKIDQEQNPKRKELMQKQYDNLRTLTFDNNGEPRSTKECKKVMKKLKKQNGGTLGVPSNETLLKMDKEAKEFKKHKNYEKYRLKTKSLIKDGKSYSEYKQSDSDEYKEYEDEKKEKDLNKLDKKNIAIQTNRMACLKYQIDNETDSDKKKELTNTYNAIKNITYDEKGRPLKLKDSIKAAKNNEDKDFLPKNEKLLKLTNQTKKFKKSKAYKEYKNNVKGEMQGLKNKEGNYTVKDEVVKDPETGKKIKVKTYTGPRGGKFYYPDGKPKKPENKVYVESTQYTDLSNYLSSAFN